MKKAKTILIAAMLAVAIATSTAGCVGGNGSVSDTSAVSQVSQENGSGYSDDNDTKVLQMLDKVTLNGKPMKIPYKQSDLPEGFTFEEEVTSYERHGKPYNLTNVNYNGKKVSSALLYNYNENQTPDEYISCTISLTFLVDSDINDILSIDGISISNKFNDIIPKFGQPTTKETTSVGRVYYYEINDNCYISFTESKEHGIMDIFITNEPK